MTNEKWEKLDTKMCLIMSVFKGQRPYGLDRLDEDIFDDDEIDWIAHPDGSKRTTGEWIIGK